MKKNMVFILMVLSLTSFSQSFEGTIKWSIKSEIADPKMKAQMEQGMQQLNDPANQAKIKEMQEKLNDPQMKAMMDANPQMKAQMESAMKMMQGSAASSSGTPSIMPSGFILKVKGGSTLTILDGGMMPMEVLHLKDKSYRLDRKNKTYAELGAERTQNNAPQYSKTQTRITKTSEKTTILGYSCTKYIATISDNGKTIDQVYWTTTDIKDFDMKSLTKQGMGKGQPMFYEGIEGVPLKMEMTMPEAKMVMEVTEIKKETLNSADFSVPTDFKQTKGIF
jgi:hypothetical protein